MVGAIGSHRGKRRWVREILGMATGASEAEVFWTDFLRSLARRGLRGVKLVVADAHEGLKAAARRVLHASAQRCRVHFMRNALAHAGKGHRRLVSAWTGTAFAEPDAEGASGQWRRVADQLRPRVPKLAAPMDQAEEDVLAFMAFPREHRTKIHSTDEIDKTFVRSIGYPSLARATAWRRAGPGGESPAAQPYRRSSLAAPVRPLPGPRGCQLRTACS